MRPMWPQGHPVPTQGRAAIRLGLCLAALSFSLAAPAVKTVIAIHASAKSPRAEEARQILDRTGIRGGLVVHLGCGDGTLTAALHANDSFLVHGLDADVTAAREYLRSLGLYGPVSVEPWTGDRLPYVGNLVNLVVADRLGRIPMAEVLRVLVPNGVALIGGQKTVKPWPKAIDQWTHYLHGPDNNAVAMDTAVGIPRSIQWVAEPRWGRSHEELASMSAAVTAQGRIFYIVDEALLASIRFQSDWKLVARDAFNGTPLSRGAGAPAAPASGRWGPRVRDPEPRRFSAGPGCGDRPDSVRVQRHRADGGNSRRQRRPLSGGGNLGGGADRRRVVRARRTGPYGFSVHHSDRGRHRKIAVAKGFRQG
ncbi:MAG: class I SAM-dependent methyltransferase [Planctomycetes bacterium]|nr:class I SAM-dependent methyltransferase [Planctomycetota bacterium]